MHGKDKQFWFDEQKRLAEAPVAKNDANSRLASGFIESQAHKKGLMKKESKFLTTAEMIMKRFLGSGGVKDDFRKKETTNAQL